MMAMEFREVLVEGARKLGVVLPPEQVAALERHVELLLKWNKTINLTAITDPAEVMEKHVVDSLALAPLLSAGSVLDAGTGAGFPGIPLAIVRPDLSLLLVDSVQKKVGFLKTALADLKLGNAKAKALRLEGEPDREGVARVTAAVSRAFAAPEEWLARAEPYLLPGGQVFCMAGPRDPFPGAVGGLRLEAEKSYRLPFSGAERRIGVYRLG